MNKIFFITLLCLALPANAQYANPYQVQYPNPYGYSYVNPYIGNYYNNYQYQGNQKHPFLSIFGNLLTNKFYQQQYPVQQQNFAGQQNFAAPQAPQAYISNFGSSPSADDFGSLNGTSDSIDDSSDL